MLLCTRVQWQLHTISSAPVSWLITLLSLQNSQLQPCCFAVTRDWSINALLFHINQQYSCYECVLSACMQSLTVSVYAVTATPVSDIHCQGQATVLLSRCWMLVWWSRRHLLQKSWRLQTPPSPGSTPQVQSPPLPICVTQIVCSAM